MSGHEPCNCDEAQELRGALAAVHRLIGRGDGHGKTSDTLTCITSAICDLKFEANADCDTCLDWKADAELWHRAAVRAEHRLTTARLECVALRYHLRWLNAESGTQRKTICSKRARLAAVALSFHRSLTGGL